MTTSETIRLNGGTPRSFKAFKRALFRFSVYGSLCVFGEVAFYSIVKVGREIPIVKNLFQFQWAVDDRLHWDAVWHTPIKVLYGQASLWMFFVYAAITFVGIEPVYKKIRHKNIFLRGAVYMVIILSMECLTGWILRFVVDFEIWYYGGDLAIFRYTSLAIAPMWFIVGLMSENFINLVAKLNLHKDRLAALNR
jgi:hypothetical protein